MVCNHKISIKRRSDNRKMPLGDLDAELQRQASEWSMTRGARSGRVAWQFIQELAGRLGKTLD